MMIKILRFNKTSFSTLFERLLLYAICVHSHLKSTNIQANYQTTTCVEVVHFYFLLGGDHRAMRGGGLMLPRKCPDFQVEIS